MSEVKIFDTTLRDGSQSENISFSSQDKLRITAKLDEFGVHYIEGGWPGSNPKDAYYFSEVKKLNLKNARIVAFGSTRKFKNKVGDDPNIQALVEAETPTVAIFGKSWILHVEKALKVSPEDNLEIVYDSIRYLKDKGREVIFDAEHFFDGFKDSEEYALKVIRTAEEAGADCIVLCDTNGGTLPHEVGNIVRKVKRGVSTPLGIHAHNDSGVAVANSIMAVLEGCTHVQGTFNGYGERCGNADLCSVIPNLQLKLGIKCVPNENLKKLTHLSRFISEVANLSHQFNVPYVGQSAFAHKGGVHVNAVLKSTRTYEHIDPEMVGNIRRVLISDLSGKSNIQYRAEEFGIDLEKHRDKVPQIVNKLKELEHEGYQFESAESSFELLIKEIVKEYREFFELQGFRVLVEKERDGEVRSEATIRLKVNNETEHSASEGNGPVNALDRALRKALLSFYPELKNLRLSDYKVRVLDGPRGTGAKVRVLIESVSDVGVIRTVGVSENIIEASWEAIIDSVKFYLMKKYDKREGARNGK